MTTQLTVTTPDRAADGAHPLVPAPNAAGQAALEAAQALGRKAASPATLRAYKADWTHYAAWCASHGFIPVPAAPASIGAYLASLKDSHAPTTIRRRLAAIGKMHRCNDLAWNAGHRDIQEPLQGLLREHGRPVQKAAALTLAMLRRLVATCDPSARGRRRISATKSMNNTPASPAKTPDDRTDQGGNYCTLFTPGIWTLLNAVSQSWSPPALRTRTP